MPAPVAADVVRIARVLDATEAEGPGRRTAVWAQGCNIRCPGCFNPHLWSAIGGRIVSTVDFANDLILRAEREGTEGITLLGGEPFEQAAPFGVIAAIVRRAGLSVMTFTGHTMIDLRRWAADRHDIASLLDGTDLLVDGPFDINDLDHDRPWVGSKNQAFHALSARYKQLVPTLALRSDRLEVRVDAAGTITVNGWADDDTLESLLHDLGRRGPENCS